MKKTIISAIIACFIFQINGTFGFTSFFPPYDSPTLLLQKKELNHCETYKREKEKIIVNPECILNGELPELSLKDRADAVGTQIDAIGSGYRSDKEFAIYNAEKIILKKEPSLFPLSQKTRETLIKTQIKKEKAELPLARFAKNSAPDLAFFIAEKEISDLKPCTRTNYLLAFQNLDGKIIKAGGEFNFNHYLLRLKGYCKGLGNLDLKFYGGVCGVSSQLFRASLTHPLVNIPIRRGHNERFSAYYGDKVEGDDAAVYETSKQLILRNTSPSDIIIKTFQKDQKTYVLLITEAKTVKNKRVEIKKNYPSALQVEIIKNSYQKKEKADDVIKTKLPFLKLAPQEEILHLNSEMFSSKYITINDELR